MEIVIEYVLLDNFVIDSTIIYLTSKLLRESIKTRYCILASLLGSVSAVLFPIISAHLFVLTLLKFCIGLSMTLIVFPCKSVRKTIFTFLTFFSITMLLGGLSYAIIIMCGGTVSSFNNMAYNLNFPIGIIYVALAFYTYFLLCMFKRFYSIKNLSEFVYDIEILAGEKTAKTKAYLDSGNLLVEPESQKPILILDYKIFSKLFNISIDKLIFKKVSKNDISSAKYIDIKTINGYSKMLIFSIDKITIKNQEKSKIVCNDVYGALSKVKLQKNFGCDVLLNSKLLNI